MTIVLLPFDAVLNGLLRHFYAGETVCGDVLAALEPAILSGDAQLVAPTPALTAAAALARWRRTRGDTGVEVRLMLLAAFLGASVPLTLIASLTGPGATSLLSFPLTLGAIAQGCTASVIVNGCAQVMTVGTGGSESLGDCYSLWTRWTVKSVSGSVVLVPNITRAPKVDANDSMTDVEIIPAGSAGSVVMSVTNGERIGTGCVVKYSLDVSIAFATG